VLGIGPDRFDHQVKFIGAVDLARHTGGLARHAAEAAAPEIHGRQNARVPLRNAKAQVVGFREVM
jgi:hypothetical protein